MDQQNHFSTTSRYNNNGISSYAAASHQQPPVQQQQGKGIIYQEQPIPLTTPHLVPYVPSGMEKAFMDGLWKARCNQQGRLEGRDAFAFFMESGLPRETLRHIWEISLEYKAGSVAGVRHSLGLEQFYVAMRLISVAQAMPHMQLSHQTLETTRAVKLPLALPWGGSFRNVNSSENNNNGFSGSDAFLEPQNENQDSQQVIDSSNIAERQSTAEQGVAWIEKSPIYKKGDVVIHTRSSDGLERNGTVVGVHTDDAVNGVYYTIKLVSGHEIQTTSKKLRRQTSEKVEKRIETVDQVNKVSTGQPASDTTSSLGNTNSISDTAEVTSTRDIVGKDDTINPNVTTSLNDATKNSPIGYDWSISEDTLAKYRSVFATVVQENGYVGGPSAVQFFSKSGLSMEVLGRIWSLSDVDNDGQLSEHEFCVAFHLTICIGKRGYPMPNLLPECLLFIATSGKIQTNQVYGNVSSCSKAGESEKLYADGVETSERIQKYDSIGREDLMRTNESNGIPVLGSTDGIKSQGNCETIISGVSGPEPSSLESEIVESADDSTTNSEKELGKVIKGHPGSQLSHDVAEVPIETNKALTTATVSSLLDTAAPFDDPFASVHISSTPANTETSAASQQPNEVEGSTLKTAETENSNPSRDNEMDKEWSDLETVESFVKNARGMNGEATFRRLQQNTDIGFKIPNNTGIDGTELASGNSSAFDTVPSSVIESSDSSGTTREPCEGDAVQKFNAIQDDANSHAEQVEDEDWGDFETATGDLDPTSVDISVHGLNTTSTENDLSIAAEVNNRVGKINEAVTSDPLQREEFESLSSEKKSDKITSGSSDQIEVEDDWGDFETCSDKIDSQAGNSVLHQLESVNNESKISDSVKANSMTSSSREEIVSEGVDIFSTSMLTERNAHVNSLKEQTDDEDWGDFETATSELNESMNSREAASMKPESALTGDVLMDSALRCENEAQGYEPLEFGEEYSEIVRNLLISERFLDLKEYLEILHQTSDRLERQHHNKAWKERLHNQDTNHITVDECINMLMKQVDPRSSHEASLPSERFHDICELDDYMRIKNKLFEDLIGEMRPSSDSSKLLLDLESKRKTANSIFNRSMHVASEEGNYNRHVEFWHKMFESILKENTYAVELLHGLLEALNSESVDSDHAKNILRSNQFREYLLNVVLMHNVGEHIYCSAALSFSENLKEPQDLDSAGKEWISGKDELLDKLENLCIENYIVENIRVGRGKPDIIKEFYLADKWESTLQSVADERCGLSLMKLGDKDSPKEFGQLHNMPDIPHFGRKYKLPVLNFWLNKVSPSLPV